MTARELEIITRHARERCISALRRANALGTLFDERLPIRADGAWDRWRSALQADSAQDVAVIAESLVALRTHCRRSARADFLALRSVLLLLRHDVAAQGSEAWELGVGDSASGSAEELEDPERIEAMSFFILGTITRAAQAAEHMRWGSSCNQAQLLL